jgi:hypothetical protein
MSILPLSLAFLPSLKEGEICFRFDVGRAGYEAKHCRNEVHFSTAIIDSDMELKKVSFRFFYSVQNLLSSRLLSKSLKIKIYRTIILPVVLYG